MKYDVIFQSNGEPNADKNWELLLSKCPSAKRVDRVTGLREAFLASAHTASTNMFWLVDADCVIMPDFTFEFDPDDETAVFVWRSKNPINDLVYGHGGIKLLPRQRFIEAYSSLKVDVTTSISNRYVAVNVISNITEFNVSPEITWRTAFRECAKLSGNAIESKPSADTIRRLDIWCTVGRDRPFGEFCVDGANAGRKFGSDNCGDRDVLIKVNDFGWLNEQFKQYSLGKHS